MLERHAIQKLHGDEGLPVLLANVVNGADVGMIQSRGRLGFALKARQSLRILGDIVGKELQRDEAMQPRVFRLIDDTHATAAQLLNDLIMGDGFTDHSFPARRSTRMVVGSTRGVKTEYRATPRVRPAQPRLISAFLPLPAYSPYNRKIP